MKAALAAGADGSPKVRMLLSKALAVGEELVATLREHPSALDVELAGQRAALGRRRQGPRHRRRLERPRRARRGLLRVAGDRRRALVRPGRRAGADPLGPAGRPAHRPGGGVRQPAPALHRLGPAQRGAAHRRGQARPARERVRHRRRRDRRLDRLSDRGGGLRAARHAVDPARAARGPRRAGGGAQGRAAAADRAGRHPRRPAHAHDRLRRPRVDRGDGRDGARARLRVRRDHRPLGQPRLRRRRAARRAAAPGRAHPRPRGRRA